MTSKHVDAGRQRRLTFGLLLLLLLASFSFGAIVRVALADHYHVACVGHGFAHGSDVNDGSFFSRIDAGCGTGGRICAIYHYGSWQGDMTTSGNSMCNAWSHNFGNFLECASSARVWAGGVFSEHTHRAHYWCG